MLKKLLPLTLAATFSLAAVADEVGEIAIADRGEAFEADRVVEARHEVVCGVDERTVEIEDNERSGHGKPYAE